MSKCHTCRLTKSSAENRKVPLGKFRDPKRIGRVLSIDFMEPFPHSYGKTCLLVVIEPFSKFAKSLKSATAESVIEFLTPFVLYMIIIDIRISVY